MNRIRDIAAGNSRGQTIVRTAMIVAILLLAATLRIMSAQQTLVERPIRNDALEYVAYAVNMSAFNIYSSDGTTLAGASHAAPKPDAIRPPGYPLFLRAIMGNTIDMRFINRVSMIQACLGIGVVVLGMVLAMLLLGYWPGVAVGLAVAVNPHLIVFTVYLLTETLYSLAVIVFVSIGALALSRHSGWLRLLLACLTGVALAIACLIRPTLDQLALALLLIALVVPSIKRFRREIILLMVGWALMMTPWWVRNETTLGRTGDAKLMVETVHQGSYPDFMLDGRPETSGYPYSYDPRTKVAESSLPAALHEVGRKFAEHPLRMLRWYVAEKPFYLFKWTLPDGWGDMFTYPILRSPWLSNPTFILLTSLMRGLHWPLVLLGLLGTVLAFTPAIKLAVRERWRDSLRWLAAVQVFVIAVHVAGSPFPRYSVPFRPLLFILAMFSISVLVRWLQIRKQDALRMEAADHGRRALP